MSAAAVGNEGEDFLAELEQQLQLDEAGGGMGGQDGGGASSTNLNEDVERLCACWLQEESCPEVLPFQADLVQDLYELVENQQGFVDEEQADPSSADTAVLYSMELDRVKFLLRRYLKARLRKIERQVLFVMSDPTMLERLSAQEKAMADGFNRLLESYAQDNFLGRLPVNFRSLTELSRDRGSLVEEPDFDDFVFCRVKNSVGLVQVDDSAGAQSQREGSLQDLRRGDVHVLKYRVIRPLVLQGDVELI